MAYRLGVDIRGTFTDFVLLDEASGPVAPAPGDMIVAREAAGAGYGDPRDRPPERVLADGGLSPSKALREHGVSAEG